MNVDPGMSERRSTVALKAVGFPGTNVAPVRVNAFEVSVHANVRPNESNKVNNARSTQAVWGQLLSGLVCDVRTSTCDSVHTLVVSHLVRLFPPFCGQENSSCRSNSECCRYTGAFETLAVWCHRCWETVYPGTVNQGHYMVKYRSFSKCLTILFSRWKELGILCGPGRDVSIESPIQRYRSSLQSLYHQPMPKRRTWRPHLW